MSNNAPHRVPATGKGNFREQRSDLSRSPREPSSTGEHSISNMLSDDEVKQHIVERLRAVVPLCSSKETKEYTPHRHPHACAHCAQDGTRNGATEKPDIARYSARDRVKNKSFELQFATTPQAVVAARFPDAERRKVRLNSPLSRGYHTGAPPPKDPTAAGNFRAPKPNKLTHSAPSHQPPTTDTRTVHSQGAAVSTHRQLDYEAMEEEAATYMDNHQQYSEEEAYEMVHVRLRNSHISDNLEVVLLKNSTIQLPEKTHHSPPPPLHPTSNPPPPPPSPLSPRSDRTPPPPTSPPSPPHTPF